MPEGEKIYFKNLDTIRFIAALLVYLHHGILNNKEILIALQYKVEKMRLN